MASLALISDNSTSQPHPRAAFLAARDELRSRTSDLDLAELWAELAPAERRMLLASANLDAALYSRPVDEMTPVSRRAIRDAVYRMSHYAERLTDRLHQRQAHPSVALAASARAAIAEGDTTAALHFLNLIEQSR